MRRSYFENGKYIMASLKSRVLICVLVAIAFAAATRSGRADVIMLPSENGTRADNRTNSPKQTNVPANSIPLSQFVEAIDGTTVAQSQVEYAMQGDATVLDWTFAHARSSNSSTLASSASPAIQFQVDTVSSYDLSGFYELSGGGFVRLAVQLSWYPTPFEFDILFQNIQTSEGMIDQYFTLGGLDGDNESLVIGSLSGRLRPGFTYNLSYGALISNIGDTSGPSPASAVGNLRLEIRETSIPEPGSIMLACFGVVGFWFRTRCMKGSR